jgi:hypothetical protein
MTKTNTMGASMPHDFAVAVFDRLNARVAAMPGRPEPAWSQFAGAWNAVGYRFLAAARADARFVGAYRRNDRLSQELDLFAFVSTACSAIECMAYAVHAVGAMLAPDGFPIGSEQQRKGVNLSTTAQRLESRYPVDSLAALFIRIRKDHQWRQLVDWRDIEIHRGTPGRLIHLSARGPAPPPDMWQIGAHRGTDVPVGPDLTHAKRKWLALTINEMLVELDAFLTRRAVP